MQERIYTIDSSPLIHPCLAPACCSPAGKPGRPRAPAPRPRAPARPLACMNLIVVWNVVSCMGRVRRECGVVDRHNTYIYTNGPNRGIRGQREGARLGRAHPPRARLEHHHPGEAMQGALRPVTRTIKIWIVDLFYMDRVSTMTMRIDRRAHYMYV